MRLDDFDFDLPEDRIALRPVSPRHNAKLLSVNPKLKLFEDGHVFELPDKLSPGDALVFNNTKVIPARLIGKRLGRGDTTPKIEITLHKKQKATTWSAFAKPARKLEQGDTVCFGDNVVIAAKVIEKLQAGEIVLHFETDESMFEQTLAKVGVMPLPPYIASKRKADDRDKEDYQTSYADKPGAIAAPTAGLHFSDELIQSLEKRGVSLHFITLHVGAGTFLPVKEQDIKQHKMHAEWALIDEATARDLNGVKERGGRIVSVGTTSLRALESFANSEGFLEPSQAETNIFITPGYRFRYVDMLLTNFHLPRSTLFMLVSAFCGLDVMQQAYAHAIEQKYRFYSYGDACLLHRANVP